MAIVTVYDLLEVNENASKEEIEKSYLKLVNEYRIDPKYSQKDLEENELILKKLKLAYDILTDDAKRQKYDADLAQKRAEELIKNVAVQPSTNENAKIASTVDSNKTIQNSKLNESTNIIQNEIYEEDEVYDDEYEDESENESDEIQLTETEKKNLKKAAEKEFKENLKKAQKAEEEYNKAYNEAYNDYLRKLGYSVKEPWTFKRIKKLTIGITIIVLVCVLIWILPPTKNLLIQIYENNFIIKSLVDIVAILFNAIVSAFK